MIQQLYQLCTHSGEEWALILTTAPESVVAKVWKEVMKEEEEEEEEGTDPDYEPLDRFLEQMQVSYPDTDRYYIAAYIKP